MDIIYIKDAPNGKAGSKDTVTEFEGNILIQTGIAKRHTKPKRKKQTEEPKSTEDSE